MQPLRALALIYLALAHDADAVLDKAELDTIERCLHRWYEDGVGGTTVLGTLKEALALYGEPEQRDDHLAASVKSIRDAFDADQRQALIDDLVAVAEADGHVLTEEARFIKGLADAWEVHAALPDPRLWNVLTPGGADADTWTPLHDLAFLYITLAHDTDDHLGGDELDAILKKLQEWLPDADEDSLMGVLRRALDAYVRNAADPDYFVRAVRSVGQSVPTHQREALLADLRYVAAADGIFRPAEQEMIREMARAWGMGADA